MVLAQNQGYATSKPFTDHSLYLELPEERHDRILKGYSEKWHNEPIELSYSDPVRGLGSNLITWRLPGHGYPRYYKGSKVCGTIRWHGHSSSEGWHSWRAKSSCGRFDCPDCWQDWMNTEAEAIETRFLEIKHRFGFYPDLEDSYGKLSRYGNAIRGYRLRKWKQVNHFIVSPEKSRKIDTLDAYRALRSEMIEIAKSHGIRGGVAIFHSYRMPNEEHDLEENSPHWHIIGVGWHDGNLLDKRGWVIKNKGKRKSIFATAQYLLSHASQGTLPYLGSKPLRIETWFGCLSYAKIPMGDKELAVFEAIKCPVCHEMIPRPEIKILRWMHSEDPPDMENGKFGSGDFEIIGDVFS